MDTLDSDTLYTGDTDTLDTDTLDFDTLNYDTLDTDTMDTDTLDTDTLDTDTQNPEKLNSDTLNWHIKHLGHWHRHKNLCTRTPCRLWQVGHYLHFFFQALVQVPNSLSWQAPNPDPKLRQSQKILKPNYLDWGWPIQPKRLTRWTAKTRT